MPGADRGRGQGGCLGERELALYVTVCYMGYWMRATLMVQQPCYHLISQDGQTPMDLGDPSIKALLSRAPELRRDALIRQAMTPRRGIMLRLRRAHEAHWDARLVFRAAAEGRPLEL